MGKARAYILIAPSRTHHNNCSIPRIHKHNNYEVAHILSLRLLRGPNQRDEVAQRLGLLQKVMLQQLGAGRPFFRVNQKRGIEEGMEDRRYRIRVLQFGRTVGGNEIKSLVGE